jgi:hypothetical protein
MTFTYEKLFISHAHDDEKLTRNIVKLLEICFPVDSEKILCTSDASKGLAIGDDIAEALRKELTNSKIVMCILTRHSLRSSWVLMELGFGWGAGKILLPLLFGVEPSEVPGPYKNLILGKGTLSADWKKGIEQIRKGMKWKMISSKNVKIAISNFKKTIPSFPEPIDDHELTVLDAIYKNRNHKQDTPVRLLEGPIQTFDISTPNRKDESQFMPVDYDKLCNLYPDSVTYFGSFRIPYEEVHVWDPNSFSAEDPLGPASVICSGSDEFVLASNSVSHKLFQVQAYSQYLRSGKVDADSSMVRVEDVDPKAEPLKITIKKAHYSDQIQSNLVSGWAGNRYGWIGETGLQKPFSVDHLSTIVTYDNLHGLMVSRYEGKLPPLHSNYLANTLGVAVILFYKKGKQWLPLINHRKNGSGKKAVYLTGWGCTSSFAVPFTDNSSQGVSSKEAKNLTELIGDWMYDKINEEALIEKKHIKFIKPLALCREFQRIGKPQLFYAGWLNLDEVKIKDVFSSKRWKIHCVESADALNKELNTAKGQKKYTSEFIANWYYAKRYFLPMLKHKGVK